MARWPRIGPGQMASRRVSHAARRVLLREVREGSHPDDVHRRARTRRLQVPWLWGQGAQAAPWARSFPRHRGKPEKAPMNMEGKAMAALRRPTAHPAIVQVRP